RRRAATCSGCTTTRSAPTTRRRWPAPWRASGRVNSCSGPTARTIRPTPGSPICARWPCWTTRRGMPSWAARRCGCSRAWPPGCRRRPVLLHQPGELLDALAGRLGQVAEVDVLRHLGALVSLREAELRAVLGDVDG